MEPALSPWVEMFKAKSRKSQKTASNNLCGKFSTEPTGTLVRQPHMPVNAGKSAL